MSNDISIENADDRHFMTIAIEEARRSTAERDGRVHPFVGVVVARDGRVLTRSHRVEGRHGEFIALEQDLQHEIISGATVYTTLEPCTRRGPGKIPCFERLVDRRVGRVVIGMLDPNPNIRGLGVRLLERFRVQVDFFPADLREQIEDINRDFIRVQGETPVAAGSAQASTSEPESKVTDETIPEQLHNDERQAMRAYLQRAEVRLSTMHRIAGAFLGGAGLLFLLPVFFRDYPRDLAGAFAVDLLPGPLHWFAVLSMCALLVVSLVLPVYSLYLLMKDIVLFYFIGHSPGFSDEHFYPRFALTAIAFSPDESPRIKHDILELERSPDLVTFAVPFSSHVRQFDFDKWRELGPSLLSPSRTSDEGASEQQKRLMVAVGQAGLIDRDLVGEVAKMEVSLVRHNVHLRRLVLRYAKALLLMIWTIVVSFAIALSFSLMHGTGALRYAWVSVLVFYGAWLIGTPRVVRMPIDWIYEWANRNSRKEDVVRNDPELTHFEKQSTRWCRFGWVLWCVAAAASLMGEVFIRRL